MNLGEIRALLKKYNQEQLLNGYEKLDERKQKQLLEQIQNIDFELVNSLYLTTKQEQKQSSDEITPIEYMDKYKLYDDYKYYDNIGKKAIREGKLAAVTMAGGQGTRLGHDGPKGTFDIGLDSHKSLFELLCDSLKEEGKKYGVTIPQVCIRYSLQKGNVVIPKSTKKERIIENSKVDFELTKEDMEYLDKK